MEKMKIIELKIPNLGEAESTEIIEINISNGSKISENDPLIVLESEKAAMEIPSDFSGEIQEVLVGVGDLVSEGQIFATIHAEKSDETICKISTEKIYGIYHYRFYLTFVYHLSF